MSSLDRVHDAPAFAEMSTMHCSSSSDTVAGARGWRWSQASTKRLSRFTWHRVQHSCQTGSGPPQAHALHRHKHQLLHGCPYGAVEYVTCDSRTQAGHVFLRKVEWLALRQPVGVHEHEHSTVHSVALLRNGLEVPEWVTSSSAPSLAYDINIHLRRHAVYAGCMHVCRPRTSQPPMPASLKKSPLPC